MAEREQQYLIAKGNLKKVGGRRVLGSLNSPLERKQKISVSRDGTDEAYLCFVLNQVKRPRIVQITIVSHETRLLI